MAISTREPFLAYVLVRAAMHRRRRAAAPIAASRLEEHAHALELLADLIRALPDDDERLLTLSTLAVRDGQFVPGASTEHDLSQFAGTSRVACDRFLTSLVQLARDDALGRAREHGLLPPRRPRRGVQRGGPAGVREQGKSGRYRAPAVKRAYIPKGDGWTTRPIGVPTFEDKILQQSVAMVLEPIYEQDFLDCSYGFRPGRSAHQALQVWRDQLMRFGGGWVIELDVQRFFDTLDKAQLRALVRHRVRDGVLLRLIGKWLNAGVLEDGAVWYPEAGTPQGGVISPLANIFCTKCWTCGSSRTSSRGSRAGRS